MASIVLENKHFRLVLSQNGTAESLVLSSTGEECLSGETVPFCTLVQERPYNNEIKLAEPIRRMAFGADRLRMEDGKLIVGFEKIRYEAVVAVEIKERYMVFTLERFHIPEGCFGIGVEPIEPPAAVLRLVQLPLAQRAHFGRWLNVLWDDTAAVNVLAACPYANVGAEGREKSRVLYGEVLREVKLMQAGVALIVSEPHGLMDGIAALEEDRDLPRGVESRRSGKLNHSYYAAAGIDPTNVEEHIAYAKAGGFRYLKVYYDSLFPDPVEFSRTGAYDVFHPTYPNGLADVAEMVKKIKAAGIIPGLHILHTHIGMATSYLTPVADHRLNLTRQFTLAKPAAKEDTVLYVEEDPTGVPRFDKFRVLRFMGELIHYDGYTDTRPYCFTGCRRGYNGTAVRDHERGTIGGILDISEFCANSAYIDQRTSLQDEIAEQIAKVYDVGFEFLYFDGSEGVNPPFDIHVALAQWRVYRKLSKAPLFCEGAAKSHFSWHMLSGGNAFDMWKPHEFKEMVAEHPFKEAAHMAEDFTRVNFGWWGHRPGMRPDIIEYGTALAAAWDCPGSLQTDLQYLAQIPRTDDILQTLRRWEDARACGFITEQVKEELRRTQFEHTLLTDEAGNFELVRWKQAEIPGGKDAVTAFVFERKGKTWAACWSDLGSGRLWLPLEAKSLQYVEQPGGEALSVEEADGGTVLPVANKRYLVTELTQQQLAEAFSKARLL